MFCLSEQLFSPAIRDEWFVMPTACHPSTLAGPKASKCCLCCVLSCHQFQQGASRHFRDKLRSRSLKMLSISQGCTFGKVYWRFVEEKLYLMAMLSASTPGTKGSNVLSTATTFRSQEWAPWKGREKLLPYNLELGPVWLSHSSDKHPDTDCADMARDLVISVIKASLCKLKTGFMGW